MLVWFLCVQANRIQQHRTEHAKEKNFVDYGLFYPAKQQQYYCRIRSMDVNFFTISKILTLTY